MQQAYMPVINTRAYPAMCLQYIDDAGNAPQRSNTAKDAYTKELKAGRIRTTTLPANVWVVVWFSFSKGSYTYPNGHTVYYKDAWHIAFAKRSGSRVEVHDSEVHSGARDKFGGAYTALEAVEAWFSVYGARYVGWSTHCDGREYAKEEEMLKNKDHLNVLFKQFVNRKPTAAEEKDYLSNTYGYALTKLHPARTDLPTLIKENTDLKKQLSEKPKEVIVEKPVEVIKEIIKEVPVEKIVEKEIVREVIKGDESRTAWDLIASGLSKLFGGKK